LKAKTKHKHDTLPIVHSRARIIAKSLFTLADTSMKKKERKKVEQNSTCPAFKTIGQDNWTSEMFVPV